MATILLVVLALSPWDTPTEGEYIEGKSTFYARGVMEDVIQNRRVNLDGYVGAAVLNRAGDLFREIWIMKDGIVSGPYYVIDCAQEGAHYKAREEAGLILEVSWEQSRKWHMNGPSKFIVRVYFSNPIKPDTRRLKYIPQ